MGVDVHAKVPNRGLDLAMAKQYLDGPKVASGFVNKRRLRTAQRMGAILFRRQPDCSDPLVHQPGVLTGAQVAIGTTRLGKAKSSIVPPRRSSQESRLALVSAVISNWTGLPVLC